jgi:hypothetical protein
MGELRETIIGMTAGWQLLFVALAMRGSRIRIISARRATRAERKRYEDG